MASHTNWFRVLSRATIIMKITETSTTTTAAARSSLSEAKTTTSDLGGPVFTILCIISNRPTKTEEIIHGQVEKPNSIIILTSSACCWLARSVGPLPNPWVVSSPSDLRGYLIGQLNHRTRFYFLWRFAWIFKCVRIPIFCRYWFI